MESAMRNIPKHLKLAVLLTAAAGAAPAFAQAVDYGNDSRVQAQAPAPEAPAGGGEQPAKTDRTPGGVLDDSAITAKVKTQLAADAATKARNIHVDTKGATVTLSGKVGSAEEKVRAVEIARATKGVKSVDDQLSVSR